MKVQFHPGAREDLREGRAFYRQRSPLAALAFARAMEAAVEHVRDSPHQHPLGDHGTRRFVLPGRFPYVVVYRLRNEAIVIVAVAHQSREPGYWRARL